MTTTDETNSLERSAFGRHVERLRREREMTREQLGERAWLSTETIEQIEAGDASLTLATVRKLAGGLDLTASALFERLERRDEVELRRLVALLRGRGSDLIGVVTSLARMLVEAMDDADLSRARSDE